MGDLLRAAAIVAVTAGALAFALRRNRPQPEPELVYDDYAELLEDTYLLDLTESGVMLDSKFPFVGSVWGEWNRIDEDDE